MNKNQLAKKAASAAIDANGRCRARLLPTNPDWYLEYIQIGQKLARRDGKAIIQWSGGYCSSYSFRAGRSSWHHTEYASSVKMTITKSSYDFVSARVPCDDYGGKVKETIIERACASLLKKETVINLFNCGVSWKTGKRISPKWEWLECNKGIESYHRHIKRAVLSVKEGKGDINSHLVEIPKRDIAALAKLGNKVKEMERTAERMCKKAEELFRRGYRMRNLSGVKTIYKSQEDPAFWKISSGIVQGAVYQTSDGEYLHCYPQYSLDHWISRKNVAWILSTERAKEQIKKREDAIKEQKYGDIVNRCRRRWMRRHKVAMTRGCAREAGMCDAGIANFCRLLKIPNDVYKVPAGRLYSRKLPPDLARLRDTVMNVRWKKSVLGGIYQW